MKKAGLILCFLGALLVWLPSANAADLIIESFDMHGQLVFKTPSTATEQHHYRVERATSLMAEDWTPSAIRQPITKAQPISPNWPQSSQVHPNSFVGKLRAKTGLTTLDLPTESQWEYACRAGTGTALNSGKNLTDINECSNADEVGRYYFNHPSGHSDSSSVGTDGGTAKVGSYLPNAWGLYDMHGNVWEWCLDWYGSYPGTVMDAGGKESGSTRIWRGGSWVFPAESCRSPNRGSRHPASGGNNNGFRLSTTLP